MAKVNIKSVKTPVSITFSVQEFLDAVLEKWCDEGSTMVVATSKYKVTVSDEQTVTYDPTKGTITFENYNHHIPYDMFVEKEND